MSQNKNISLCALNDYASVSEALLDILKTTKSKIRKYDFSKKFLSKKVFSRDELSIDINLVNFGVINSSYTGAIINFNRLNIKINLIIYFLCFLNSNIKKVFVVYISIDFY